MLEIGAGELIKTLMKLGEMVTITQSLSDDAISILAEEFERQVEIEHAEEEKEIGTAFVDDPADLVDRAPVASLSTSGHIRSRIRRRRSPSLTLRGTRPSRPCAPGERNPRTLRSSWSRPMTA